MMDHTRHIIGAACSVTSVKYMTVLLLKTEILTMSGLKVPLAPLPQVHPGGFTVGAGCDGYSVARRVFLWSDFLSFL